MFASLVRLKRIAYIAAMPLEYRVDLATIARVAAGCALLLLVLLQPQYAIAHPEDEFCVPGEPGIDPALCRALAALNSGEQAATDAQLAPPIGRSRQRTWLLVDVSVCTSRSVSATYFLAA